MMLNMVQALNQAMHGEMGRDPNVVVLGEDVAVDGGVFRLTEGLLEKFGPGRVIDTPLAESAIVGASIGMAVSGMRPVAEIQFMGFIYLAFNQIISHAARLRNRSRGRFTVPFVIRTPYGAGVRALEHHSESTEALFCYALRRQGTPHLLHQGRRPGHFPRADKAVQSGTPGGSG
jgi:pyruvate dehydrogenase E1 component beta subunit